MQRRMLNIGIGAVLLASLHAGAAQAEEARCATPLATLASSEGLVEAAAKDVDAWRPVRVDARFCPGDRIRVGANSRAAVVLSNHTVMRLDALSTLNFTAAQEEDTLWVQLLRGVGHFISRVPRRLTVSTPYVNAGVEGTEFLVTANEHEAAVTVYEGRVSASNPQGTLLLTSGQSAAAASGAAPALRVLIRPRDGLQWALHYPPVIQFHPADFEGKAQESWETQVARSLATLNAGDATGALAALQNPGSDIADARFFNYRASLYLAVGRVDAARSDIDRALAIESGNGDALALQAVIALAQNDKARGLVLARQAVEAAPQAPGPRLALSYAWQAHFELERARDEAKTMFMLNPQNALAWARLAELHLMFGERGAAIAAAQEAIRLNPRLARSQSMLGFAYLSAVRLGDARLAFEQAAALDPGDPLPHLGLGLVQVREGRLAAGRQQMELAASLDPNDAVVRSYLGKAYYEEQRDPRAEAQFDTAKDLDPSDPTPWFYDAILKQSANRPVEALENLQTSIALNDNRAVYRSRLLLESDAAARSASLARIYGDLGFQQLAVAEAWKSLATDPSNHSAHRFLADSYTALPRHEVARVSEVLQAQLLQPVTARPVNPSAAETSLFVLEGSGPTSVAFNEFTPLFTKDRVAFQGNIGGGVDDTFSDEAVLFGNYRNVAASLGQLRYTTDGYRANNDFEQNIYNAFLQYDLSDATSAQAEWRRRDIEGGDVAQRFGADNFDPLLRQNFDEEVARAGFRHAFTPRRILLGSLIYSRQERHDISPPSDFTALSDFSALTEGYQAELQSLVQVGRHDLTLGAGHADQRARTVFLFDFGGLLFPVEDSVGDRRDGNFYIYDRYTPLAQLHLTLGVSYDRVSSDKTNQATAAVTNEEHKRLNPKFGLLWTPTQQTTVRLAAFRTLRRLTHANQTIEPTEIAGFNQFFDDIIGTRATRYGIGIDHQLSSQVFVGLELSRRNNERPVIDPVAGTVSDVADKEALHRAYLYRILNSRWNVAAEYFFNRHTSDFTANVADPRNPVELTTHYLPLSLNYHHPNGFFGKTMLNLVAQHVGFSTEQGVINDRSHFGTIDFTAGYRLASRKTIISISLQNLFDRQFNFHDTSLSTETPTPLLARFRPDMTVFASAGFWF